MILGKDYYKEDYNKIMKYYNTSLKGLSKKDIVHNQKKFGKNEIIEGKKKGVIIIFLEQYNNLLVFVLIAAAILSYFTKGLENTFVIVLVITLNAILGTIEYFKAEKSLKSLQSLSSPKSIVYRDGKEVEIDSKDVVCGDILVFEAGDIVCADAMIINSSNLEVDESSLTGECLSVAKNSNRITETLVLGERKNLLFRGTKIILGKGLGVACKVGMETEIGKIAKIMSNVKKDKSPLEKDIDKFSRDLAIIIIIICLVIFFLSLYRHITILDSLIFAISLAVAAIPEALQTIVTIVLSISTEKLAKEKAIVKDIKAIETLGNVDIICSDKTGTITQNKMTVDGFSFDENYLEEDSIYKKVLLLCNEGKLKSIDTINIDKAILQYFIKKEENIEKYRERFKVIVEEPFSSLKKMALVYGTIDNQNLTLVKGASEVILNKCSRFRANDILYDLDKTKLERIQKEVDDFSLKGYRVIALAYSDDSNLKEDGYIFLGFVYLNDPPKEGCKEAIEECIRHHIKPIMITGDHLLTAIAIGKKVGIYQDGDKAMTGMDLTKLTDNELLKIIENISIWARVSPADKIRIVSLLQKKGHSVAFIGDGVNDSPALKKADCGISMGISGTDVSKEAASVILMDDNYGTIVKAIKRGRKVYQNIQNAILFLIAGNIAGIFLVLYTTFLNLPMPFAPVHLLFINLINDSLPAIAIGVEEKFNTKKDLLYPRDLKSPLLTKRVLKRIIFEGLLIALCTIVSFYIGNMRNGYVARTMVFVTITVARLFYSFNCRGRFSFIKLKRQKQGINKTLIISIITGLVLINILLFIPVIKGINIQEIFAISKLNRNEIIYAYGLSFIPMMVIQMLFIIREYINYKKRNKTSSLS